MTRPESWRRNRDDALSNPRNSSRSDVGRNPARRVQPDYAVGVRPPGEQGALYGRVICDKDPECRLILEDDGAQALRRSTAGNSDHLPGRLPFTVRGTQDMPERFRNQLGVRFDIYRWRCAAKDPRDRLQ